jgi:methionyl aminopeptidase
MSIETPAELRALREAGRITRQTLDALAAAVRAGVTTGGLDAIAAGIFKREGARSAPAIVYGFPGHVLISVNDEIVHGIPGPRILKDGDLVKLDVTVEKDGYVADAARAGTRVNEIGRAVEREVRRRGFTVVRGLAGHGVGRTIHEAPSVPTVGRSGRATAVCRRTTSTRSLSRAIGR